MVFFFLCAEAFRSIAMFLCRRLLCAAGGASKKAAVQGYLEHLEPVSKELTPLYDLLPNEAEGTKTAYEFQAAIIQEVIDSDPISCWKVVAPQSEGIKPFKAVDPVCGPIFHSTVLNHGAKASLNTTGAHHIEFGLLLTIQRADGGLISVTPAIELVGSRWPYCAPHLPGYVADLCGHCRLVVGSEAVNTNSIPSSGAVLTKNHDPQQVGYAKDALGDKLNFKRLLQLCDQHMPSSEMACETVKILTPAWGGRVPAKTGEYEANFGPLGKVSVTLEA